jgi:peroxiredoxin/uncharacterized membrane protein YphA (DoxX/SURF4 family)
MDSFKKKYFDNKIHIVILILRILFGILFIFSATTKFIDLNSFESSIKKFALVPDYFAGVISYLIPSAEFILGLLMIFKIKPEITLQLIIYMLITFTSVITVKLVEGGDISCGCFGSLSSNNIDYSTILRNLFLMGWASIIFIYTLRRKYYKNASQLCKSKVKVFFFVSILIFLLVQNSAFAIRNLELRNRIYWLVANDILSAGKEIKPIKVYDLEGAERKIIFNKSKYTILFVMQYGCHLCKENVSFWNQLATKLNSNKSVRIIGISIDDSKTTEKLALEYSTEFELVFNPEEDFRNDLKLFKTPLTLVINKNGLVDKVFKGKLNNVLIQRIAEEVFEL